MKRCGSWALVFAVTLLTACGSGGGTSPGAMSVLPAAAGTAATQRVITMSAAATSTTSCAATTADAGSLRGLAAGDGCTAVACTVAPTGSQAAAGSLRGLAAGGSCAQSGPGAGHVVVKPGGKHDGTKSCPPAGPGAAACDSLIGSNSSTLANPSPDQIAGLQPADLASAYAFSPVARGAGQTVAIVDAFDDPNAESDLATYRSEFGLPPCTSAGGCFTKTGVKKYKLPKTDTGWANEIALDLDMVSAVCPACKILLVEADSDQLNDLAAAVDVAAAASPNVISNSYYVAESQLKPADVANAAPHYSHPGIAMTVSSGDHAYGATFPGSLSTVIAVGATTLVPAAGPRGWIETAWHGSGAGCSAYSPKPAWQTDAGCPMRTLADLAVVGDPDTGVAVYNTFGGNGWYVEGGTSVGAPVVAAMIALAGNAAQLNGAALLYAHASAMFPIDAGSDGTCSQAYLCTALAGYDGPTGLGSPNGLSAL